MLVVGTGRRGRLCRRDDRPGRRGTYDRRRCRHGQSDQYQPPAGGPPLDRRTAQSRGAGRAAAGDINPTLELHVVDKYIKDEETDLLLDSARFDYAVDAIDTLSPKLALILGALKRGIPLVSLMGAGAKTDPTRLGNRGHLPHPPLPAGPHAAQTASQSRYAAVSKPYSPPNRYAKARRSSAKNRTKKSNTGTISYLPALFGIGCASVVVRE